MLYESVYYSHLDSNSDESKNEEKRIEDSFQSDCSTLSSVKLALNHHHHQHSSNSTKNVPTKCKKEKSSKPSNSKPRTKNSLALISNFNELIERANAERGLESKPDSIINNLLHAKLNIHENSLQSSASSSLSPNDSSESLFLQENLATPYEMHRFNSEYSSFCLNGMEHSQIRNSASNWRQITENFQHFNSHNHSSESMYNPYVHGDDVEQARTSNPYHDSSAFDASPSSAEMSLHNANNNSHENFNLNSSLESNYYPLSTRLSCHLNQLKINNQSFGTFQNESEYQTSAENAYQSSHQQSHAYSHRANESLANSYNQMNYLNESEPLYYDEHSPSTANNETYYNHVMPHVCNGLSNLQANAIYYNNAPHDHNNFNHHQIEPHLYPISVESSQSMSTSKTDMESLSNVSLDSVELKQAIRLTKKQMKSLHQRKTSAKISTVHQSTKSAKLQKNYLKHLNASTSGYMDNQCFNQGQEINASHFVHQQYATQANGHQISKRKRKRVLNRLQRAEATMREKRRMLKLNKAFEELRKVLPISEFAKNKLSRAETLKSAIEYIDRMSQMLCIETLSI
jgi:hypothetical protein